MKRIIYIILIMLSLALPVYAENEYYIQGENDYNKTAESIIT